MNIGKLNLDVRVCDCSSCKNLVIEDHSYYLTDPEKAQIQITLPGIDNKKFTFEFNHSRTNIFNSYSFGLSKETSLINLPEGLYTITYMICPFDELFETTYYIRQCEAWCKWRSFLRQSFDSCLELSKEVEVLLNRIEFLLKGAEAFAEDCEPEKAVELHQKAIELLDRLECQLS